MRLNALAAATSIALFCLPGVPQAHAQMIGELEVRSRLGERFFAAVPVRADAGVLDPRCVRVLPNPNAPEGADPLPRTRVRIGSADSVIIETADAVNSPIVGLRLEVGCQNSVSRDFVVLGDLPDTSRNASQAAAATVTPAAPAATVAPVPIAPVPRPARRQAAPVQSAPAMQGQTQLAPDLAAVPPPPAVAAPPRAVRPAPKAIGADTALAPTAGGTLLQSENARRLSELQARSDDQAAALLALEDRLALLQKQAELLKLQLEQAMAAAPASAQPASSPHGAADAAPTAAAATSTSSAASSAPATSAGSPIIDTAAKAAPAAAIPALVQPSPRKEPGLLDILFDWRVGGALAVLVLGALALKLRRRPVLEGERGKKNASAAPARPMTPLNPDYDPSMFDKTGEYPVASSFAQDKTAEWPSALQSPSAQRTAEWIATPPPATDNFPVPEPSMTTSQIMRANPAALSREFHITQQFQPEAERVVALSSPEEIVQQARTHYMDDNDVFRAIDLLEMAVSARKDSPRPWQALFAIYRRERMPERYQRLVLAYRSAFGEDDNWPAIQSLGREIDQENRLYAAAAQTAPLPEDLLERWLGVPLDFTAHLLANEMHDQLMSTNPGRKRRRSSAQ
jgi:hypothetical protein